MEKGPNQPQSPGGGHRRRRRRRGASGKKQHAGQPKQSNQPSNNSQAARPQGGRRSNRGRRGGPAFVGPMDHSYRNGQTQNGNVSDAGNRGGGYHVSRFPQPDMTPVTARADAPPRIFCFVDDLFFLAKIQETARKINVKVEFVKAVEPILDRVQDEIPENDRPSLVVFDLNNLGIKPLTLIPKLRAKLKKTASIIGFVSHIQGDLKMKAQEAGCDMVMPRSAFSQNLAQLLRRHGAPEDLHEVTE
jgi:CheY-like chemotaxis protein